MKYNININQKALAGQGLDIKDCAMLDYLYVYCNSTSPKIASQRVAGQTWINYQALMDDMPILEITSRQAIAPRIKKIEKAGFIKTKLRTKGGKRKLYVELTERCDDVFFDISDQVKNEVEPVRPALHNHNTIDNNTIDNNTSQKEEESAYSKLPDTLGSSRMKRILRVYSKLWKKEFNVDYAVNFGRFGKALKNFDSLTEPQVTALIITHFTWYGMDGKDDFAHKRLFNAAFPFEWLPASENQYIAYLTNVEKVDWNDDKAVYSWVGKQINKLNV